MGPRRRISPSPSEALGGPPPLDAPASPTANSTPSTGWPSWTTPPPVSVSPYVVTTSASSAMWREPHTTATLPAQTRHDLIRRRSASAGGVAPTGGLRRHPLRDRRGHRQADHLPARGAQRVPPQDAVRARRRVRARPRRPRRRRGGPHRRGPRGLLLRRRPTHPWRRRLRRRPGHRPPQRPGPADPDPPAAQAGDRHGGRLRHRRRARPAPGLRPDDRGRQRPLRPDRTEGRLLRRRLRRRAARPHGRPQEGSRDLVPVRPVRRPAGPGHGAGQHGGAARRAGGDHGRVVPQDPGEEPAGAAAAQGRPQRRLGRPGGHPAARRRRHPALLHDRGGPGGPQRLPREAPARLRQVPAPALTVTATSVWLRGARPRTLVAAVCPVLVGTAAAASAGPLVAWRALAALVVAVGMQVGVNYANDYSDGIRGTDAPGRIGPTRLVATGLATPAQVRLAAVAAFAVAAAAGLALAVAVDLRLVAVGAAAIAAAVLYTGGPRPYGYRGLGELSVLLFFGLVATAGSAYVQLGRVPAAALVATARLQLAFALLLAAGLWRS